MPEVKVKSSSRRVKKTIASMLPVKKWLSLDEAMAYTSLSINNFDAIARIEKLTVSGIGSKRYYSVAELDNLFENNKIVSHG